MINLFEENKAGNYKRTVDILNAVIKIRTIKWTLIKYLRCEKALDRQPSGGKSLWAGGNRKPTHLFYTSVTLNNFFKYCK